MDTIFIRYTVLCDELIKWKKAKNVQSLLGTYYLDIDENQGSTFHP